MSILPPPISLNNPRRFFRKKLPPNHRRTLDILLTRSRITNLGVFVLSCFAFISFVYNLTSYFSYPSPTQYTPQWSHMSTIARSPALQSLNHLIIVPGHSIWKGSNPAFKMAEDEWFLEPWQKGGGRVAAFVRHITKGAELAAQDERSLLVFSGGQTRLSSTMTEADSYLRLALTSNLLPTSDPSQFPRATTENHALDSYQNLLFSIARFHEYTGKWPEKITVVGYKMKRRRFVELHREAVRWPIGRFEYVGIDAEGEGDAARQGELQNGYTPYTKDIYGCHPPLLSKRLGRNPYMRFHSYYTSSPELAPLLDWCPDRQTQLFTESLPWDRLHLRTENM